jgi:hypothetical protein
VPTAPVIERGDPRRHRKAHPFVMPAFEGEKPGIISDIGQATKEGAHAAGLT